MILAPLAAADIPPVVNVIFSSSVTKVVAASKSIISELPLPSLAAVVNTTAPSML